MTKIFYSQRFHDKTEEEIYEERSTVKVWIEKVLKTEVEIFDQYKLKASDDDPVTWNWAQDLLLLGQADLAVFCNDWEKSLGCQMEMLACRKYKILYVIMPKL